MMLGGGQLMSAPSEAKAIQPVLAASKDVARASMALSSASRASVAFPSTVLATSKAVP
jgi:hypothetical protein